MSTLLTVTIGKVLSLGGKGSMGSAMTTTPYPVATSDRPFVHFKDSSGRWVVKDRKTGRIVKAWGDGKTTKEAT